MNRRVRISILFGFVIIVALSLFQVLYRIFRDSPLLDMNPTETKPLWSECNDVFANMQMDTVASCIKDDSLHITLSLSAIRKMSLKSFLFKEGRYEMGRYRTYYSGGIGHGVGYTNGLFTKDTLSRLYFAGDSIIDQDSLSCTCIFVGQYVTISDDDSKLLTELRLPRRSTVRVTLDSSSTGILLKIITAAR